MLPVISKADQFACSLNAGGQYGFGKDADKPKLRGNVASKQPFTGLIAADASAVHRPVGESFPTYGS